VKSQNLSTLHIPPTAQVGSYAQVRAIQGWLAELLGLEDRVTAMPVDKALEQLLAGVESGTAVVIIIDGIDEAEREFLDVFEQYFLEPLCRHSEQGTCSISLLLLGRHYYEWRSFFLRQFDEREHVWELKPFEGQDASDVLKIQLPAATTMPSDLEAFIAQGAYPGHIVQAAYAWRDHKSICDVLAYMIHREWESVLGLSPNIGLDLVKSPSNAFTRGQVKALLQEHIPTLQSQGATEKFRQLIEARILHWNSKDERWKLDQAYWLLFKLYLQNCGMD